MSTTANAQPATIGLTSPVITGQGVSLGVNWSPGTGISTGGLQFLLNYNSAAFAGVFVTTGPAAAAAGKTAYCSAVSGAVACVIEGINANALPAGVVAQFSFTFAPSSTSSRTIQISSSSASSLTASAEAVTVPIQPLIIQTQPTITWPTPATIPVGQALSGTQLDATADVAGNFSYSPKLGTILPVGLQTLTAIFTPTDTITYSVATATALLTVSGLPTTPASLSCAPASLGPNTSSICTVTLNQAAQEGGASVVLSNTSTVLAVPTLITVPTGSTTGTFTVTTATFSSSQSATITATFGAVSQSATLTLLAAPALTSLACSASRFLVGIPAICTVTLSGPGGAVTISVSSTNAAVAVPANVALLAGASTATFAATAQTLASGWIVLSASLNGLTKSAIITVSQPASANSAQSSVLHGISCTPKILAIGSTGLCRVDLSRVTNTTSTELRVSSSSDSLKIPATVVSRPGQWGVEFQVEPIASPAEHSAVITVQLATDTIAETIEVPAGRSTSSKIPHHIISESGRTIRFNVYSPEFRAASLATSLPFGSVFDPAYGNFQWTPDKNQEGVYDLAFNLTSPEAETVTEHVSIEVDSGVPAAIKVVNAATHSPENVCSPGALAYVEGRRLTTGPPASDPSGSSFQLSGTSVTINGDSVPILYASPDRVEFQCPVAPPGTRLSIIVEAEQGATQPLETIANRLVPGVFSADGSGSGQGMVTHAGSSTLAMIPNFRYPAQAAQSDDHLAVEVTGVDGAMAIFVNIAGIEITPESVNPIPARAGISKVSFTVPNSVSPGSSVPLFIKGQSWDGIFIRSNVTTIAIEH